MTLIPSVPGRHFGKNLYKYGHMRVRAVLAREEVHVRPGSHKVAFQVASIMNLSRRPVRGCVRIVWFDSVWFGFVRFGFVWSNLVRIGSIRSFQFDFDSIGSTSVFDFGPGVGLIFGAVLCLVVFVRTCMRVLAGLTVYGGGKGKALDQLVTR